MNLLSAALTQIAFLLVSAPLVLTIAKRTKAFWQQRRGPRLLQGYYDLAKLLRKTVVRSEPSTALTTIAPVLALGAYATASALLPLAAVNAPLGFAGDFFAFVYLFALARFVTALAGLDSASPFGGLGSSREITFGALIEPGLVMAVLALAYASGATSVSAMGATLVAQGAHAPPALLLALAALLVLVVAELNRVPVDNPATHLELTMVHEAMVLEQSGPNLALVEYGNAVKHVAILGLVVSAFLPWTPMPSIDAFAVFFYAVTFAKIVALMIVIATSESWMAKWRVFRVPELTTIAFIMAALALLGMALAGGPP